MSAIGGFVLDATVTEDHVMENDVTEDPVEDGPPTTDNIRERSDTLTLECVISESPIGDMVTERKQPTSRLVTRPGGIALPTAVTVDPYRSIVNEGREYMRELAKSGRPVVVETATRIYDSMGIVSIRETRDAKTGEAFRFTAMFKQVRIVTNDRETVQVAIPRAKKKHKNGHATSKPTPATAALNDSMKGAVIYNSPDGIMVRKP